MTKMEANWLKMYLRKKSPMSCQITILTTFTKQTMSMKIKVS